MNYPSQKPTSRSFDPGDFPIKKFRSQSGVEVRILYGSNRTNMRLSLTYENISDDAAEEFLDHYEEMKGTFNTFFIGPDARTGWEGEFDALGAGASGNAYRYESPPQVQQVRPGISSVTVSLIGVL